MWAPGSAAWRAGTPAPTSFTSSARWCSSSRSSSWYVQGDAMTIIIAILQAILLVAIAPLLSGITRKIRAKMHSRTGTSVLQDYYDLAKLWRRCEVKEGGSGVVSRLAPPIFLGSFILLAAGLPLVTQACPVPILGDIIAILYLMALPRSMFALASIDSAGSYTAIGGVRELLVGVLVEPSLHTGALCHGRGRGLDRRGAYGLIGGRSDGMPLRGRRRGRRGLRHGLLHRDGKAPVRSGRGGAGDSGRPSGRLLGSVAGHDEAGRLAQAARGGELVRGDLSALRRGGRGGLLSICSAAWWPTRARCSRCSLSPR